MPEYNVHWTGYVSHVETVEADSAEAAMDAAQEGWVSLCNQCSREWGSAGDPEVFTVTDADGNTAWEANPVRPLPTREQIADVIQEAFYGTAARSLAFEREESGKVADKLLALLRGE